MLHYLDVHVPGEDVRVCVGVCVVQMCACVCVCVHGADVRVCGADVRGFSGTCEFPVGLWRCIPTAMVSCDGITI